MVKSLLWNLLLTIARRQRRHQRIQPGKVKSAKTFAAIHLRQRRASRYDLGVIIYYLLYLLKLSVHVENFLMVSQTQMFKQLKHTIFKRLLELQEIKLQIWKLWSIIFRFHGRLDNFSNWVRDFWMKFKSIAVKDLQRESVNMCLGNVFAFSLLLHMQMR